MVVAVAAVRECSHAPVVVRQRWSAVPGPPGGPATHEGRDKPKEGRRKKVNKEGMESPMTERKKVNGETIHTQTREVWILSGEMEGKS